MRHHLIWPTAFFFLSVPVFSQALSLNQAIESSLQKNIELYRIDQDYDNQLAEGIEMQASDNPRLEIDYLKQSVGGGTGYEIELTQPIKRSQLSRARSFYAQVMAKTADIEKQSEIFQLANQTSLIYVEVWSLQEHAHLYESTANEAKLMEKKVKASASQGQMSLAATYLFSSDAAKLHADSTAAEVALRQKKITLAQMIGYDNKHFNLEAPALASLPSEDVLFAFAQRRATFKNVLKQRVQSAAARLKVADADGKYPTLTPKLLYSHSPDNSDDLYGIGIGFEVPLWNDNQAERKRAQAALVRAKSESELLDGQPQREVISALRENTERLSARVLDYSRQILPGYRKAYELTQQMFQQGQASAIEVWQVREKLIDSEEEALEAMLQAMNAKAQLELQLGGRLEEVTP